MTGRRAAVAVVASGALALALALALGPTAGPAHAQVGHSLALTGPPRAAVGQPIALQASGTVSDDPSVVLPRYVNVYALPSTVVASCPPSYQNAIQVKDSTASQGSQTVAAFVPVDGGFSIPIGYTSPVVGRFLLCGYLHEGLVADATATHTVDVAAAGAGTKPRNVRPPTVTGSGRTLSCSRGAWSGRPARYAYRWIVDGRRRAGATRRTLRMTRTLRGRRVQCAVTATNRAGSATRRSTSVRVR